MKTTINFFEKLENTAAIKKEKPKMKKGMAIFAILLAAVLIFFATFSISLLLKNGSINAQLAETTAYTENADNLEKYQELNDITADIQSNNEYVNVCDTGREVIEQRAAFDKETYDLIVKECPSRVTLRDIIFGEGVITLNCLTDDNLPPADFAENLDKCGGFSEVKYSGFTDRNGEVVFTILCA